MGLKAFAGDRARFACRHRWGACRLGSANGEFLARHYRFGGSSTSLVSRSWILGWIPSWVTRGNRLLRSPERLDVGLPGTRAWLALATLEGLIFGLGAGLAAATWTWLSSHKKRLNRWYYLVTPAWLSLIWVAREWVACHFPYGGYQWSRLGQAMANTPLANLAYWGGISLVSLATAATAVGLVLIVDRLTITNTLRALALALILWILAAVTPALWSMESHQTRSLKVLAVQGNANAGLFANPEPGSILAKHLAETYRYLNQHPHEKVDLVVWPENASDVDPLTNRSPTSSSGEWLPKPAHPCWWVR